MDFMRIICPVDLSSAARFGIRPAASLATRYGAEIILAHVADSPPMSTDVLPDSDIAHIMDRQRRVALAMLEQLAEEELDPAIARTCLVRFGTPHHEIADLAAETRADLIVLPTRSTSALRRWILGSTADKIIQSAPCPVLSVPPHGTAEYEFHPHKIVFATDFSNFSDQALPWALSLTERYEADLLMVHVATVHEADPGNPRWSFPDLPRGYVESIEENARQELEARGRQISNCQTSVRTRMLRGVDPAVRITECAEAEGADLVVLATHGRSGLAHVLLGSTAERVVRFACCPVLTIRQPARLASHLEGEEKRGATWSSRVDREEAEEPLWSVPSPHIVLHP